MEQLEEVVLARCNWGLGQMSSTGTGRPNTVANRGIREPLFGRWAVEPPSDEYGGGQQQEAALVHPQE